MLQVLKSTVSNGAFFERLKRMLNNYHHFTLKNFVYLDLCNRGLNTHELLFLRHTHETWDVTKVNISINKFVFLALYSW